MKKLFCLVLVCVLLCCFGIAVSAEEAEEQVVIEEDQTGTWGEQILSLIETHMAELFSALTLVGSMVLAYSYKKGLVPTLWGGLSSIAQTAEKTSERTRELAEMAEGSISSMTQAATPIFEKIEEMCKGADQLAEQARQLEVRVREAEDDRALVKTLMAGVADMLYGVFSSANLPQYAKEQIGQRYTAICSALGEGRHEAEHQESHL